MSRFCFFFGCGKRGPHPSHNVGWQALAPELWAELHTAALVVVKGDLNYRKLLADRHWPPTAPFAAAAHPFVAVPFVALRTLKVARRATPGTASVHTHRAWGSVGVTVEHDCGAGRGNLGAHGRRPRLANHRGIRRDSEREPGCRGVKCRARVMRSKDWVNAGFMARG